MKNLLSKSSVVLVLLSILFAVLLNVSPQLLSGVFLMYLQHQSPARKVLIGDMNLCEILIDDIKQQNPTLKEESYKQLIVLLKLPTIEFKQLVEEKSIYRNLLIHLTSSDPVSETGFHMAQKCLLDALALYPENLDYTLDSLLKADLVQSSSNSQIRLQLDSFIANECRKQDQCVRPLKEYIIRTNNYLQTQNFINYLKMKGEFGALASFEILDVFDDKEIAIPSSNSSTILKYLFSNIFFANLSSNTKIINEFNKRLNDENYPLSKKDFLKIYYKDLNSYQVAQSSQNSFSVLIEMGKQIFNNYQNKLPDSTKELTDWIQRVSQYYLSMSSSEKQEIGSVSEKLLVWSVKNLGVNAQVNNSLLLLFIQKKLEWPLTTAPTLLNNPHAIHLGLGVLLREDSMSENSQKLFLSTFKSIPSAQRAPLLHKLSVYGANEMPAKLSFEILELFEPQEFLVFHRSLTSHKKDDYNLTWKLNLSRYTNSSDLANYHWRGYVITKNPELIDPLKSYWLKSPECTETRLLQLKNFLGPEISPPIKSELVQSYINCYSKVELADKVVKLIQLAREGDSHKNWIQENKQLTNKQKTKILEEIEKTVRDYDPSYDEME